MWLFELFVIYARAAGLIALALGFGLLAWVYMLTRVRLRQRADLGHAALLSIFFAVAVGAVLMWTGTAFFVGN